MNRLLWLVLIGLVAIMAASPTLVVLAHALVPLVTVGGVVAIALRIVWYFTNRW